MSIIKWEPFGELEKVFNNGLAQYNETDLATDMYIEDGTLTVKMSIPGISDDNVEVSFEDGVLSVEGRREEEHENKEKDYYSKEILRGSFLRRISLPKMVDPSKATSAYAEGILTISLPIIDGGKDRRVKIPVTTKLLKNK